MCIAQWISHAGQHFENGVGTDTQTRVTACACAVSAGWPAKRAHRRSLVLVQIHAIIHRTSAPHTHTISIIRVSVAICLCRAHHSLTVCALQICLAFGVVAFYVEPETTLKLATIALCTPRADRITYWWCLQCIIKFDLYVGPFESTINSNQNRSG